MLQISLKPISPPFPLIRRQLGDCNPLSKPLVFPFPSQVDNWVYDDANSTFIEDDAMAKRLMDANPNSFRKLVATFLEANGRGKCKNTAREIGGSLTGNLILSVPLLHLNVIQPFPTTPPS